MLTKEQLKQVDDLVEQSKNDKTIIVGSDIRFLASLIYLQQKELASMKNEIEKFPLTIPAFFHPNQNIGEDVGQDGECD